MPAHPHRRTSSLSPWFCRPWLAASVGAVLLSAALLTPTAAVAQQDVEDDADGVAAFPEPALVTPSWALTFRPGRPDTVSYTGFDGVTRWYWYLPYYVENNTPEPQFFTARVEVLTDRGDLIDASKPIPPGLFRAINAKLRRGGLLLEPSQVHGEMLVGPDFARESVAVWPVGSQDVDEFSVFFTGLYGETAPLLDARTGEPITRPARDPLSGEPALGPDGQPLQEQVLAVRTVELRYAVPGTTEDPARPTVIFGGRRDVMR